MTAEVKKIGGRKKYKFVFMYVMVFECDSTKFTLLIALRQQITFKLLKHSNGSEDPSRELGKRSNG